METNLKLLPTPKDQPIQTEFPYRQLIGEMMYLVTSTRPDLAYSVCQLSRFVANPTPQHIGALKTVLRYLKGTLTKGIHYINNLTLVFLLFYKVLWMQIGREIPKQESQ